MLPNTAPEAFEVECRTLIGWEEGAGAAVVLANRRPAVRNTREDIIFGAR